MIEQTQFIIIIIQVDLCTSDEEEEEEEFDQEMEVQEEEEFVCNVIVPNNFTSLDLVYLEHLEYLGGY